MEKEIFYLDFENKKHTIEKMTYEYVVDEPPGGGRSIVFSIQDGLDSRALLSLKDVTINSKFSDFLLKENLIVYELEYHRIWGVGTTDVYYMTSVKDKKDNYYKIGMSELNGEILMKPKF
jgi:hypothetical protein